MSGVLGDARASVVIEGVLDLAVRLRDETGPGLVEAAERVLAAAGGDPVAALCVAAALVRVDEPVDCWWAPVGPDGLAVCGTPAAFARHVDRGEPVDEACREAHRRSDAAYHRLARVRARELLEAGRPGRHAAPEPDDGVAVSA